MDMFDKINELYDKRRETELGGGDEKIAKQHDKGKKTARERIDYLVDEGSFMELNPFIQHRHHDAGVKDAPGEGVVTGYGTINGRGIYLFAQDFTVYGGALGEMHGKKIASVMDLAAKNGVPFIGLNDSGGARIQEGVSSLDGYGHVFYRNSIYSGVIPQISVILGPCAGGAVYSPAITDFVVMVEESSQMFITGPKVIETVTGEKISPEDLGGARVHNSTSGNAHVQASTEEEALDAVRNLLLYLPDNYKEKPPFIENEKEEKEDFLPDITDFVPFNSSRPYDVRKLIDHIVDEESFFEIHASFAKNVVVGFARIDGQTAGIIANQPKYMAGGLDIDSSDKAARFIRMCDSFNIPLVTFEDVTGFFPGIKQEHGGIIRHGAKILYAYSEATVPKLTVITRKAYGGAYVALNSKSIGADIVFAWPNAEIAVMGPEGAANIIYAKEINQSDNPEQTRQEKIDEYRERFANPYVAAGLGMVDDVIDPRETRIKLKQSLRMLRNKEEKRPDKKHGNIPL
ncbi:MULTISPECIES: acyl-CoA carboxylase subunit beta [Salimicrobium]|uniref:Propionyl-CoA carboxylase beta chain n=2 Tax=Salimicrobium TaxID=351195 RepID=A0ABY1KNS7_9BACI|nr:MULTISPECIES: acyl-CoA carboxylase subunit beta [Salimicrobium]SDX70388.1 propionyl-CoA carboxylase beta chain [Salimicrobium album]SIS54773.1 propionyl-CoA carboxylase beta chain [Salimicrobium salexigens]